MMKKYFSVLVEVDVSIIHNSRGCCLKGYFRIKRVILEFHLNTKYFLGIIFNFKYPFAKKNIKTYLVRRGCLANFVSNCSFRLFILDIEKTHT